MKITKDAYTEALNKKKKAVQEIREANNDLLDAQKTIHSYCMSTDLEYKKRFNRTRFVNNVGENVFGLKIGDELVLVKLGSNCKIKTGFKFVVKAPIYYDININGIVTKVDRKNIILAQVIKDEVVLLVEKDNMPANYLRKQVRENPPWEK